MAIDAQAAAVGPGVGDGADDLLFASAEQGGAHGSGGDPDQKNVVKSYPIETVFESENSLYFVGFDHGVENIANGERFPSGSRQIIRQSQDAARDYPTDDPIRRRARYR